MRLSSLGIAEILQKFLMWLTTTLIEKAISHTLLSFTVSLYPNVSSLFKISNISSSSKAESLRTADIALINERIVSDTSVVIERVAGNVLYNQKSTGQSDDLPVDLEIAVKSVQTGDTNVTFAIGEGSMTDEQRFDAIVSSLLKTGEGELICFRKIKW